LLATLVSGCGGAANPVTSEVSPALQNLRAIVRSYVVASQENGQPPANKEELVLYLKKLGDPNELLRSPNDGEYFVVLYGADALDPQNVQAIWAYERQGKDGTRYVAQNRNIRSMTDEEFHKARFAGGHRPAS
jgi:hypothetical protein